MGIEERLSSDPVVVEHPKTKDSIEKELYDLMHQQLFLLEKLEKIVTSRGKEGGEKVWQEFIPLLAELKAEEKKLMEERKKAMEESR